MFYDDTSFSFFYRWFSRSKHGLAFNRLSSLFFWGGGLDIETYIWQEKLSWGFPPESTLIDLSLFPYLFLSLLCPFPLSNFISSHSSLILSLFLSSFSLSATLIIFPFLFLSTLPSLSLCLNHFHLFCCLLSLSYFSLRTSLLFFSLSYIILLSFFGENWKLYFIFIYVMVQV